MLMPFIAVNSQNMYNITGLLDNAPSGTARFIGMGGSMGALGGDLSVMGVNPAGTAIYRSGDFSLAASLELVNNASVFQGVKDKCAYDGFAVNDFGFLLAFEREASLTKFVNFGMNFRRRSNLNSNFGMGGDPAGYSQMYVMDNLYWNNEFDINDMKSSMYTGFAYHWLPLLASDARIDDEDGNFLIAPDGLAVYIPNYINYYSEERGGVNDLDINLSANINDRLYIGATLGCHMVNYSRYSSYFEEDSYGEIYTLNNSYLLDGSGVDFKVGAIFRPFRYSPFKIGVSVHTPTLYRLTDASYASIIGPYGDSFDTRDSDAYGGDLISRFSVRSPWRVNAAMSYTFGRSVALNAEYEYTDPSAMEFTKRTDISFAQNEEISKNLQAQHTFKLGAELSVGNYAVRAGYNHITAPFKKSAYKYMYNAAVTETSTDYMNRFCKDVLTLGLGHAGKTFYINAAYMMQIQKSDFYPFYDLDYDEPSPVAHVKTTSSSIVVGVGVRF
jgi:hypothetical protein